MDSRRVFLASRRILVVITLGLLSTSASSVVPVGATGAKTACTFEHDVFASPGLTTSPSSGTVTSKGETGTVTCNGPVNGKQPTGPGKFGFEGRYGTKDGDTCQSGGEGEGTQSLAIPTSGGVEHVKNTGTFTYGAFKGEAPISGAFQGDTMTGTFDADPMEGDCASKPLTKVRVRGKGTLNN